MDNMQGQPYIKVLRTKFKKYGLIISHLLGTKKAQKN
jgi:hypothetical protein